ncbi:RNA polymerase sigma factor [Nocardioides allogilvus]|uniref:RNA polymerase sigma factor n=1 Tax=Nocardioides allogilvus TaxID=2072017 RepID=UPI000D306260|nr:RNA polymerase sigma factor [Nocardioides allogilvus]
MDPTPVSAILHDRESLEAFYLEHLPWVRRFVARRVDDADTAADLTADVFIAAIGAADRYQDTGAAPRAWLAGIARNVVAMHHRRRSREHAANGRIEGRALLDESSAEHIVTRIDGERAARLVLARVAELPATQRAVVELVAVDGLSLTEAAAALGITATNARVRYHRGRTRLRLDLPDPFEVMT